MSGAAQTRMTSNSFQRPRSDSVATRGASVVIFCSTAKSCYHKKKEGHGRQCVPLERIALVLFNAQRRRRPVAHQGLARVARPGLLDEERLQWQATCLRNIAYLDVLHDRIRLDRGWRSQL